MLPLLSSWGCRFPAQGGCPGPDAPGPGPPAAGRRGRSQAGAVALYRKVMAKVAPASAEAHLRLSEALQEAQDADAAVAPARRAVELAPQSAEAQAHLALLQYQRAAEGRHPAAGGQAGPRRPPGGCPRRSKSGRGWARSANRSRTTRAPCKAWLQVGRLRPQITFAWERAAYPRPQPRRTRRASARPCWP